MSTEKISLDPARTIISRLGGPDAIRDITKASRTRIYRWTQPRENGGTGGIIPSRHAPKLLEAARSRGILVTAEDFIPADRG